MDIGYTRSFSPDGRILRVVTDIDKAQAYLRDFWGEALPASFYSWLRYGTGEYVLQAGVFMPEYWSKETTAVEISFNISKANLEALKAAFQQDLIPLEAAAQEIKDNIARIDRALYPVSILFIQSEFNPSTRYKVTKTYVAGFAPGSATYECECPSFKYNRGLDDRSRCKHIRKAQDRGL